MGRIVDLSLAYQEGMRGVRIDQAKTLESDGWNARTLSLYSHAGTHMDAQTHFGCGSETIDALPLERCMAPSWVVPMEDHEDGAPILVSDLGTVAKVLRPGEGLLLRTNWSRHVGNPSHYRDHFPRISEDLARWCVARGVRLLGVESPSVADVNDLPELTRIHRILLEAKVTIVEGLTNLSALRQPKVFFVAAPLRIANGDGSPCRAFAVEGEHEHWTPA